MRKAILKEAPSLPEKECEILQFIKVGITYSPNGHRQGGETIAVISIDGEIREIHDLDKLTIKD